MIDKSIKGFESNGTKPTVAVPNQLSDLTDGNRVAINESNIQGLQGQVNTHNGEIANLSNEVANKASVQYVDQKFNGASKAISYDSYSTMITAFNALGDDIYAIGQDVLIQTLQVPDLWVSGIESASVQYTYVDDATFTSELNTNGYVQVGYYKLSALETQKVDITNVVKLDNSTQEFEDSKSLKLKNEESLTIENENRGDIKLLPYNSSYFGVDLMLTCKTSGSRESGIRALSNKMQLVSGQYKIDVPNSNGKLALKTDIPQYGYQIVVRFASNVINGKYYACVNGKWYTHTSTSTISNCSEIILSNESIGSGDSFDATSAANVFIDDSLTKIYPLSDSAQITIIGPQE